MHHVVEEMIWIMAGVYVDPESKLARLMKGESARQIGATPPPVCTGERGFVPFTIPTIDVDDEIPVVKHFGCFFVQLLADGEHARIIPTFFAEHPMTSLVWRW